MVAAAALSSRAAAPQVLVAAGAVDHDELVKQAEAAFGGVPDEDASSSVATLLAKVGGCRGTAWHCHQQVASWDAPPS